MTREGLIALFAGIGTALGIFNLYRSHLNDKERLRVVMWPGDDEKNPSVEVVNHSHFPVTIVELRRIDRNGQEGKVLLDPKYGQELPQRIDARDSYSFRISLHETLTQHYSGVRYCFVRTALGSVFTSKPGLMARATSCLSKTMKAIKQKSP